MSLKIVPRVTLGTNSIFTQTSVGPEEVYRADSVANVGESGDRDRCLGTSVAYLGVNTRP